MLLTWRKRCEILARFRHWFPRTQSHLMKKLTLPVASSRVNIVVKIETLILGVVFSQRAYNEPVIVEDWQ